MFFHRTFFIIKHTYLPITQRTDLLFAIYTIFCILFEEIGHIHVEYMYIKIIFIDCLMKLHTLAYNVLIGFRIVNVSL